MWLFVLLTLYLRYDKPASCFEEALPLGNGMQGMLVYGGVAEERISLNDITLWTGEPDTAVWTKGAYMYVDSVRDALWQEDYPAANALAKHIQGHNSEKYQPLGNLNLEDLRADDESVMYSRDLQLDSAVANVRYTTKKGRIVTRRYFASYPDSICVITLQSNKELRYRIQLSSPLPYKIVCGGNGGMAENRHSATTATSNIDGYAAFSTRSGENHDSFEYDENRGIHFRTGLRIYAPHRCKVNKEDNSLIISGCKEATIVLATATSYNGPYNDPVRNGKDYKRTVERLLNKADAQLCHNYRKGLKNIYRRHLEDYKKLYDRVSLDLGTTPESIAKLPTDVQLEMYKDRDIFNPDLEETYFQYGRYLLIACSRTNGVPANLQGLWNESLTPPWSCNYTTNTNVEENYWPAEVAGLSELHETALCEWIMQLPKSGRITAREYWNGTGWCCGHNSDIWCMTNPVGYGTDNPQWACWNMGGAWLCAHLWEHYRSVADKEDKEGRDSIEGKESAKSANIFLERVYPVMKEAADFCMSMLVERDGYLMTAPSTSPENNYMTTNGYEGAVLYGGTADIAIIRELLTDTKLAAEEMQQLVSNSGQNTDIYDMQHYIGLLDSVLTRLLPYRIGKDGSLQEWYNDWEDANPKHRHQSHLIGLYPGHQITVADTPELAEACRKVLETKGEWTTGWSAGWRVCLWARLQDGEKAYNMLRQMMAYSTYPNLWDAHPPFQIDGNFGATAGVIEMFNQNAIPEQWKNAKFLQK